jgi:hypothetical protein
MLSIPAHNHPNDEDLSLGIPIPQRTRMDGAHGVGKKRGSGDPRYSRPGGRRYSFMLRGLAKPLDD